MIQIDYAISPSWNRASTQIDLSKADEMDLRYDFLLGDLLVKVDGVDFNASWGWIPILDAAAGLRWVVDELESGKKRAVFEFTENGDCIQFDFEQPGLVCLLSTYAAGRACVPFAELKSAVLEFGRRVLADALGRYPELKRNAHLFEWYPTRSIRGDDPGETFWE